MSIPHGTFDYIRDYLESYSKESLRTRIPGHFGVKEAPSQDDIDHIMSGVFEKIEAMKLIEEHGYWAVHPDFPLEDWQESARNDDTRTSYWEWVVKQISVEGESDGTSG
jgi:hypothetical protein